MWHRLGPRELVEALGSDAASGLSAAEAARRLAEHGRNELAEGRRTPPIVLFLNQFKDFMVLVLIGATLISGLLGEYMDAITILAIIVLNGVLGFVQEYRAEQSLRALKALSAPTAQRRPRTGRMQDIPAANLVPGDIVMLESGDRVPADLRLLEANSLYTEESALTGESVPVEKHARPIDEDGLPLGRSEEHRLHGHDGDPRHGAAASSSAPACRPKWAKSPT